MSRVKRNFVANLAGSGWTAILGLACTPLYIKFLGMEAYGLIGFPSRSWSASPLRISESCR